MERCLWGVFAYDCVKLEVKPEADAEQWSRHEISNMWLHGYSQRQSKAALSSQYCWHAQRHLALGSVPG